MSDVFVGNILEILLSSSPQIRRDVFNMTMFAAQYIRERRRSKIRLLSREIAP